MTVQEKHDLVIQGVIAHLKQHAGLTAIVGGRVVTNKDEAPTLPCLVVSKGRWHAAPGSGAKMLCQADVLVEARCGPEDLMPTLAIAAQYALNGHKNSPLIEGATLTDTADTLPIDGGFSRRQLFGVFTRVPDTDPTPVKE